MATIAVLLSLCITGCAAEVPTSGPQRLQWVRKQLGDTVSKFSFTQGYDFQKDPSALEPFMKAIKARGFNTWDQQAGGYIWGDAEFASLERSLHAAADAGLKVWATLSPPSGKEQIARWPLDRRREYYFMCVERFAQLAAKYPNFVAFTCDDFDYNLKFFSPEMLAEMARRWRAICPRLAFLPLLYYSHITPELFETRGEAIDGIVFHYRANSYPPALIPTYDPKNFDMYGDVMRYELKRVRQIAGDHPVICGIYIWYYKGGWGVMTPDGKNPDEAHIVRDAVQKLRIAQEYADGVRVYGLGIDHAAYRAMEKDLAAWQEQDARWGTQRGDPESHLGKWRKALGEGPFVGTLLGMARGFGAGVPPRCSLDRIELVREFQQGRFDPVEAVRKYPMLIVSRSLMPRHWPGLLEQYVEQGGTLLVEFAPGWSFDLTDDELGGGEKNVGEASPPMRAMSELSGIEFHYEPRGAATRWRVVAQHPLTSGLPQPGQWQTIDLEKNKNNYILLAHPVEATDARVLIEVEHEKCPYNGVEYARQGEITGVYPLLTVRKVGKGLVVRHYTSSAGPAAIMGDAYEVLLDNVSGLLGTQ